MNNQEMLDAIEQIQPYINNVVAGKLNRWKDPDREIALVEKLYNIITGRRYIKFCNTCPSVVREALIIINNWKKRELKKAEPVEPVAEVETSDQVDEPVVGSVEYNAKFVNETNPFNPVDSDNEPVEKPKPLAKNAKTSTAKNTKPTTKNGSKRK